MPAFIKSEARRPAGGQDHVSDECVMTSNMTVEIIRVSALIIEQAMYSW